MTDMLKTVYPPKTPFCGGYSYTNMSHLREKFHLSDMHRGMNAKPKSRVQSKWLYTESTAFV